MNRPVRSRPADAADLLSGIATPDGARHFHPSRMKSLWLVLKNLVYVVAIPSILAGWVPLRLFERHARWPAQLGWQQWAGAAIFLVGAVVFVASVHTLAMRGQGTPAFIDPPRKLTRRGPYKWVRNPMYLSLFALVGGEALFLPSWHIGVYWIVLVCSLHLIVVLHEESALRFRFGAVYEDYKRDVPRWLPRKPRPILETVAPFDSRR
jgi:protein-S-isoprenylcysteine O-methyltransferase Ste14